MSNENQSLGRELPRAKPVTLTFYDTLKTVPFTTTFYVREGESRERIEELIDAIRAVTPCVLAEYKIGYKKYAVPGYREQMEDMSPHSIGGQKWVVKYSIAGGSQRYFSIPGRDPQLTVNYKRGGGGGDKGTRPAESLPEWRRITQLVKELCVGKEGQELTGSIELDYRNESWPPKRFRR